MRLSFRIFGNAIFDLGTSWYAIGYAIKVLIINAVTRLHDFLLYLKGWHEKKQKKYIVGEVGKASKWCNRVPKVFVGFLSVGSFCGVFVGWEFLWGFCQSSFSLVLLLCILDILTLLCILNIFKLLLLC